MNHDPNASAPTRTALLTADAPGAIAVVALAGPHAAEMLRLAVRPKHAAASAPLPDNRLAHVLVLDDSETLDDALAVTWDEGRRAELHLHGGRWITRRVLARLVKLGAIRVSADDWAAADAADETEREIDAALLHAVTRRMTEWLLAQRAILPNFLNRGPDQSLSTDERAALAARAAAATRLLRGIRVAIVGPPNAGKSTLANRLVGHERVITSHVPGTTRDWVAETAGVGGWPVTLTDTAGLRATADPIEQEAIRRGLQVVRAADVVLVVLDGSRPAADVLRDCDEVSARLDAAMPRIVVLNKSDLRPPPIAALPDALPLSAKTGDGLPDLQARLLDRLGLARLRDDLPTPFTARQCALLGLSL